MSSDQNGELKSEKAEETPLNVDTDMEDAGEDLRYGWGNIRPKCLQLLNSPKCFVTALAFFSFIQGNSTDIIAVRPRYNLETELTSNDGEVAIVGRLKWD